MSQEITRLRDLSKEQVRSGLAAWLGWLFDGLDMHLYTLVATPFVASLMQLSTTDPQVDQKASIIQAAFLVGWALGGAFFGRIGDLLGRRKALVLTILTYACFTGLSSVSQNWQQLMLFRFLSALGIGGEWAVGASLLVETWPKAWRPWIAATLQSAVNIGVLFACFAGRLFEKDESNRLIFLAG
ncbi:MAG TPA: MFS transporter, partial [Verrucomicrobiaceae bacterium]